MTTHIKKSTTSMKCNFCGEEFEPMQYGDYQPRHCGKESCKVEHRNFYLDIRKICEEEIERFRDKTDDF